MKNRQISSTPRSAAQGEMERNVLEPSAIPGVPAVPEPLRNNIIRNGTERTTSERRTYGCCVRPRSWVEDQQEREGEVEPW